MRGLTWTFAMEWHSYADRNTHIQSDTGQEEGKRHQDKHGNDSKRGYVAYRAMDHHGMESPNNQTNQQHTQYPKKTM